MRQVRILVMLTGLFLLLTSAGFGQEEGARGWLESRAKSTEAPAAPAPPKPTVTAKPTPKPTPRPESALGLGYTLFLQNKQREYVPVNPSQVFRSKDLVRLLVESNKEGYV